MQDKTDGQINVVKKSFDQDAPPADLYDSIKIEAPAAAPNPKTSTLNPFEEVPGSDAGQGGRVAGDC